MTYRPSWRRSRVYVISIMRAQDSVMPHQKSVPRIMAGNCRLWDYHYRSKWRCSYGTVFCRQSPKLHGNIEGVVYINDAGCDGVATYTSTITYGTLRGATKNITSRKSTFLFTSLLLVTVSVSYHLDGIETFFTMTDHHSLSVAISGLMPWMRVSLFSLSSHLIFGRHLCLVPVTFILIVLLAMWVSSIFIACLHHDNRSVSGPSC